MGIHEWKMAQIQSQVSFFCQAMSMVNKPQPKNFANFQSYANAVRQWYLNKPLQSTNTLQLFTNALQNYFQERAGPSNQQNMVHREVIKMYKSLNNLIKNKSGTRVNDPWHGRLVQKLKKSPHNSNYQVRENLRKIKRNLHLPSTNNASLKTFSKIFEKETGIPLGPAYNIIKKQLTSWKPTGRYVNLGPEIPLLRHPNTGNIGFMTGYGRWKRWENSQHRRHYFDPERARSNYLRNLNIWRNEDGTLWVHINGKWRKLNFK